MGIADRIILTLYTILMTVASVLTLLCSLGVFSDTGMVAFISHIPGNWVYAVGGVIMLLVSVRLLITGLGLTGVSSLKLSDSDKGKVLVGKGATLRDGTDVTIIAVGMNVQMALAAAEKLAAEGISKSEAKRS